MRPLVSAREVSKAFGSVQVLQEATFDIFDLDRVGLMGRNGAGKSTLLKLITGEEETDLGELEVKPGLRIGSLTQYQTQDSDETIAENLQSSDYLASVTAELRKIEARMIDPEFYKSEGYEEAIKIYSERQAGLARFEGDRFMDRALGLLADLGFEPDMSKPIFTLSGGERRKLALAKLLVASPDLDLLLLDEPTNHLDIETIEWLEAFLLDYKGSIVIVSHDRYLLDDTVERIFELEGHRLRTYKGDYTDYAQQKEASLAMNRKAYQKYVNEMERNRAIIEKLRGRNKFDAQIRSRLTRMAKIAKVDDAVIREKVVKFKFKEAGIHSRIVVETKDLEMRFGDNALFRGATFEIMNGDKIGIIGPNGCGKTTLLKLFLGEERPTSGSLTLSKVIKPGYFNQGHLSLDPENDPIQELQSLDSAIHEFDAKALLGRFLFKGDMVRQKVKKLSGGEKARLSILKLVLSPLSLLLLDEPTNHLDIPAQHVVAAAINSYNGTACIVSHDRYFLDSVANRILSFRGGKLELYSGNYTNYRAQVTSGRFDERVEGVAKYVVDKKFTDWSTGQRYVPGDIVEISEDEFNNFRWAMESGRLVPLKRDGAIERHKN
ncbi:MAG: ABC-F family ATP-binding cassette domain-containing protein [Thermoplasmata archaeon]|nr:ABC-F family ATP-binding cassette domain-containing protein [Thermoplasmata archaeon]